MIHPKSQLQPLTWFIFVIIVMLGEEVHTILAARNKHVLSPPVLPQRVESVLLRNVKPELMPLEMMPNLDIPVLVDDDVSVYDRTDYVPTIWSSSRDASNQPVIYEIGKPTWGFSQTLWGTNQSIDALLLNTPSNVAYAFISDEASNTMARQKTSALKALIMARADALNASQLLNQMIFSSASLSSLSRKQPWISELLCQWPTFLDQLHANIENDGNLSSQTSLMMDIPMVNSFYDWLGWSFWPSTTLANRSIAAVYLAESCGSPVRQNLTNRIAIVMSTGQCDAYTMVKRAADANASAVVVVASTNVPQSLNCKGSECNDQSFGLPAVSIGKQNGLKLINAIKDNDAVKISFSTVEQCGTNFAKDYAGRLVQAWGGSGLGNPADTTYGNPGDLAARQYPSLAFLAYAAQNLNYLAGVDVRNAVPAIVRPVFNRTKMRPTDGNCYNSQPWGCGPSAVIEVPPPFGNDETQPYRNVIIDYSLQCNTTADVSCPQWDHVIQLKACCSTLPLSLESGMTGGNSCDAQNGFELGRWITSFGRGNGHWRTDVTQWLPLLRPGSAVASGPNSYCNMTIFTVPWAGNQGQIPWLATLNLRFENTSIEGDAEIQHPLLSATINDTLLMPQNDNLVPTMVLTPWQNVTTNEDDGIYTLFKWIAFNQSYETYFDQFVFTAPDAYEKAELITVLSGHGNDNHGCGEFCSTTHHFTISAVENPHGYTFENVKNNSGPDNPSTGCAEISELALGTTPNEYGTWLYGRDGWCDGRGVYPWTVDITSQLRNLDLQSPSSRSSQDETRFTLNYRGLWNGTIPDPSSLQQGAPVMMMQTYIVFWS